MSRIHTAFLSLPFLIAAACQPAFAGGVAPGATRLIYSESASQASLPVTNSDSHERYLIQAWVENEQGQRAREFIVTPPLFTAAPKSENTLRVVYSGKPLPQDREVVYWLNIKAIPAVNKEALQGKNTLQLAVLSRIKLFMRPEGFSIAEPASASRLRFHSSGSSLTITNPTPYYQSLVNISVNGKKIKNTMVPPLGKISVSAPGAGEVRYQTINDYGALSAVQLGKQE